MVICIWIATICIAMMIGIAYGYKQGIWTMQRQAVFRDKAEFYIDNDCKFCFQWKYSSGKERETK